MLMIIDLKTPPLFYWLYPTKNIPSGPLKKKKKKAFNIIQCRRSPLHLNSFYSQFCAFIESFGSVLLQLQSATSGGQCAHAGHVDLSRLSFPASRLIFSIYELYNTAWREGKWPWFTLLKTATIINTVWINNSHIGEEGGRVRRWGGGGARRGSRGKTEPRDRANNSASVAETASVFITHMQIIKSPLPITVSVYLKIFSTRQLSCALLLHSHTQAKVASFWFWNIEACPAEMQKLSADLSRI